MSQCQATTKSGEQCKGPAGANGFCQFHDENFPGRCKARSKSTGKRCRATAVADTGVCRLHGGKAALANRGRGNGNFKHGLFSKHLPTKLVDRTLDLQTSSELLTLHSDIQLSVVRINDLLDRLNDQPLDYAGLSTRLREVQAAMLAGEDDDMQRAMSALQMLIMLADGNHSDLLLWREVETWLETRRKLVDSEVRQLEKLQSFVPLDQVLNLLQMVFAIVEKHVQGPPLLAIKSDFSRIDSFMSSPQQIEGELADPREG